MKEETLSEGRALLLHPRVSPWMSPMLFVRGNDSEPANKHSFEVCYNKIKLAKNRSEYERRAKIGSGGGAKSRFTGIVDRISGSQEGKMNVFLLQ